MAYAAEWQRAFQTALAASLRALRVGDPGATFAMCGICFGYGFFHAVGPGHGKLVIGGYGLGRNVPFLRLSTISVLAALGQALTAIALVGAGFVALGWTRERLTDIAETVMLPLSTIAIGLIGAWLVLRGARRLLHVSRATGPTMSPHANGIGNAHGSCGCGHRHGPTPEDIAGSDGWRETILLIASIAIRPCSGAILLLVLAWYMDLFAVGLLGVVAISLGTAVLTIGVAALSVFARRGAVLSFERANRVRAAMPIFEIAAGLLIAVTSIEMIGMMS